MDSRGTNASRALSVLTSGRTWMLQCGAESSRPSNISTGRKTCADSDMKAEETRRGGRYRARERGANDVQEPVPFELPEPGAHCTAGLRRQHRGVVIFTYSHLAVLVQFATRVSGQPPQ